jgi:hypothetical protein
MGQLFKPDKRPQVKVKKILKDSKDIHDLSSSYNAGK